MLATQPPRKATPRCTTLAQHQRSPTTIHRQSTPAQHMTHMRDQTNHGTAEGQTDPSEHPARAHNRLHQANRQHQNHHSIINHAHRTHPAGVPRPTIESTGRVHTHTRTANRATTTAHPSTTPNTYARICRRTDTTQRTTIGSKSTGQPYPGANTAGTRSTQWQGCEGTNQTVQRANDHHTNSPQGRLNKRRQNPSMSKGQRTGSSSLLRWRHTQWSTLPETSTCPTINRAIHGEKPAATNARQADEPWLKSSRTSDRR